MAFDEAWKNMQKANESKDLSPEEKLKITLEKIAEHPFLIESRTEALQVASFRIRLLNLS